MDHPGSRPTNLRPLSSSSLEAMIQAVKAHDKYQLEVKLDYELYPGKETHYKVRTYLFVPQNLGINERTYPPERFYRHVQNYIRLKTPSLDLHEFTTSEASPLRRIERMVSVNHWSAPDNHDAVVDTLKLVGATVKSALRDHVILIQRRLHEAASASEIDVLVDNLIENFVMESGRILAIYRALHPAFNLPNVDERLYTAYRFIDEWISLQMEETTVELYQIAERWLPGRSAARILQELTELNAAEEAHRRSRGYRSLLRAGRDNEEYIYRLSVLKKFSSSVLFLKPDISLEGEHLEHLLFALAAGISMIFATVVAFYAQQRFGQFTFPFFAALVLSYMFKDRIKELGRAFFTNYLRHRLFDRRITIRDRDDKHELGYLREKVDFVDEEELPAQVLRLRSRDEITEANNDGVGEKVLCYAKEVVLRGGVFGAAFPGRPMLTGINDIMRYDLRSYLRKMDEPFQSRKLIKGNELTVARCHKVYHLNIVSVYELTEPTHDLFYLRTRLVLDRKGIKRVEHLTQGRYP